MMKSKRYPLRATLAKNVRGMRTSRGWSQEELGHKSGISQTYISQLESARRAVSIDIVEAIAVGFDIPAEQLLKA